MSESYSWGKCAECWKVFAKFYSEWVYYGKEGKTLCDDCAKNFKGPYHHETLGYKRNYGRSGLEKEK